MRHMSRDRSTLIIYHVPWCRYCNRTFPIFLAACSELRKLRIDAQCAHVDCSWDKPLCLRWDIGPVKPYPTFMLFAEGESVKKPREAKCPHTKEGFITYLRRMVKNPVQHLARDLHKKQRLDDYLVNDRMEPLAIFVAIIPDRSEPPVGVQAAADEFRDRHGFYAVSDLTLAFGPDHPLLPVTQGATYISFSTSRQQWAANNGTASPAVSVFTHSVAHNITTIQWTGDHRFPGIWRLYEAIFNLFVNAGRRCVIVAVHPDHDNTLVEAALHHAHESLQDEFYFGVLEGLEWADMLRTYNVYMDDLPRVIITENGTDSWIEDVEQLRVSELESDLRRILAGAPVLRSGHSIARKARFYSRELRRWLLKTWVFAQQGPQEAAMFAGAILVSLGVSAVAMYFVFMIIRDTLLLESDADQHAKSD